MLIIPVLGEGYDIRPKTPGSQVAQPVVVVPEEEIGQLLGTAFANIINLLDPGVIIIGGGVEVIFVY